MLHEFRLIYKKYGQYTPNQCERASHALKHGHAFQSVVQIEFEAGFNLFTQHIPEHVGKWIQQPARAPPHGVFI
jgi:hypothetical protein